MFMILASCNIDSNVDCRHYNLIVVSSATILATQIPDTDHVDGTVSRWRRFRDVAARTRRQIKKTFAATASDFSSLRPPTTPNGRKSERVLLGGHCMELLDDEENQITAKKSLKLKEMH